MNYSDLNIDLGIEYNNEPPKVTYSQDENKPFYPLYSKPNEIDENSDEIKAILHTLRHFHFGNPQVADKVENIDNSYLPASLNIYRDAPNMRYDYPLFLDNSEALVKSLGQQLEHAVNSFAPNADSATVLKDNLARLESYIRSIVKGIKKPVIAKDVIISCAIEMLKELDLATDHQQRLQADLDKLIEALPADGQLLSYYHHTAAHLLIHAIEVQTAPRRKQFLQNVTECILGLERLLAVEYSKSDEAKEPKVAQSSLGILGDMFDAASLSCVISRDSDAESMSNVRLVRVKNALEVLQTYQENNILIKFLHCGNVPENWLADNNNVELIKDPIPTQKAKELFDKQSASLASVFAAVRIAKLELVAKYDEEIHDPWFANFNWEGFSKEEILLCPSIVVLESADTGVPLENISNLLSSGRPIQILLSVQAHNNPRENANADPLKHYRVELGYFAASHRQAVVSQASAARPFNLVAKYLTALGTERTSLHIINTGMQTNELIGPWLISGAALESRSHPFFAMNPENGYAFADRMDFSDNPQAESDWPTHKFQYGIANSEELSKVELAFTFADYALLINSLQSNYAVVPANFASENLISIADYLALNNEQAFNKVPFIWAVNGNNELRKLVVSRALVVACRDRLNYWHTLQELAGINNKYVTLAAEKFQQDAEAKITAETARIQAEYDEKLAEVRREGAAEVMQRLTDVLLGMDFSAAPNISTKVSKSSKSQDVKSEVEETAPKVVEEAEEEVTFSDPWIDSPMCTSCDDCIRLNDDLFVYNDNKQAIIANPTAGTYAELVEAAEFCPAKCIHPGQPLDKSEKNLEELMQRAEAFN
jgi:ferredoxin